MLLLLIFPTFILLTYLQTHEAVVEDKSTMDQLLCDFFVQYRTINRKTKKKQLPKRKTMEAVRSHLKNHILRNNNKLDFSVEVDFPKFALFWKGFIKELKTKGLGDTVHNKALSKESLTKINELLVLLHQAMIGQPFLVDESQDPPVKSRNPKYDGLLKKIPKVKNEKGKFLNKNIATLERKKKQS